MKYGYATHSINPFHVAGGGKVWNFGFHCTKISTGCKYCWSETQNLARGNGIPYDDRDVEFTLNLSVFDKLPKKKPAIVAVQYMGDLFHRCVPEWKIANLIDFIQRHHSQHKYLLLTKRLDNVIKYNDFVVTDGRLQAWYPNIWLGASIENQETADERIPKLLQIPAAKRWLSIEPMIEEIDFGKIPIQLTCKDGKKRTYKNKYSFPNNIKLWLRGIDWVVVGCESGTGKRPCKTEWILSIVNQCQDAGVPVFVKQIQKYDWEFTGDRWNQDRYGLVGKVIKDMSKFPENLQIREMPV